MVALVLVPRAAINEAPRATFFFSTLSLVCDLRGVQGWKSLNNSVGKGIFWNRISNVPAISDPPPPPSWTPSQTPYAGPPSQAPDRGPHLSSLNLRLLPLTSNLKY